MLEEWYLCSRQCSGGYEPSLVRLDICFLQCTVSDVARNFCLIERKDWEENILMRGECNFYLASLGYLESLSTNLETPLRVGAHSSAIALCK